MTSVLPVCLGYKQKTPRMWGYSSSLEDFKEEKKQPIDYRRSGVLTLFAGIGLFLFGIFFINLLKGIGLLVGAIGVGQIIAGYLYPNDSAEITKAVENFEKK